MGLGYCRYTSQSDPNTDRNSCSAFFEYEKGKLMEKAITRQRLIETSAIKTKMPNVKA